jgi:hypothetical protein
MVSVILFREKEEIEEVLEIEGKSVCVRERERERRRMKQWVNRGRGKQSLYTDNFHRSV